MSQRWSEYERKERDLYETPEWVTAALLPHMPKFGRIWEPACGRGKMARVLKDACDDLVATDIESGVNFISWTLPDDCDAIVTNPPYDLATEFIKTALLLMQPSSGFVAMLLRTDFDHAATRRYLFRDHKAFAKKLVLTKRIKWFEDSKGQPSFNHAWFIWDWRHAGPPTIAYAP